MFALAMADGREKVCRRRVVWWRVVCRWSVVCRGKFGEWVKEIVAGVWPVGTKTASGSRGLSLVCGLSWRKGRVGQENCRWSVVCRGKFGEWVKRPVSGVWSVGASLASGSRGLSAECGLSGRKGRVGQENCRWRVVCRAKRASGSRGLSSECGLSGEKGEWVKRPVSGVWSVVAKRASGSRGLSLVCGLSWRKGRVGQRNCRRSVVCRGENAVWVKRLVAGVWPVVAKRASGSKKLSLACGLSGRKRCVGQEACRWYVVCRGEIAAWVKEIVASVWSVGAKRASGSKKSYISYASNVANHHSDQNCQNPQNMIHLF